MEFSTSILFYLLAGAGVSTAVWARDASGSLTARGLHLASAVLFWPLYLPLLTGPATASDSADFPSTASEEPGRECDDDMARAVRQTEVELESALRSLDGWSDGMLDSERSRIDELQQAWRNQADRVRELDVLLASPGFKDDESHAFVTHSQRGTAAESARRENIARLRQLRDQLDSDLMATLDRVRELVTMIYLVRFSGAPASRATELVAQISAAVESLSEVHAWQSESPAVVDVAQRLERHVLVSQP